MRLACRRPLGLVLRLALALAAACANRGAGTPDFGDAAPMDAGVHRLPPALPPGRLHSALEASTICSLDSDCATADPCVVAYCALEPSQELPSGNCSYTTVDAAGCGPVDAALTDAGADLDAGALRGACSLLVLGCGEPYLVPDARSPLTTVVGGHVYDAPGTHTWIVPPGVYSFDAVLVGGGGSGGVSEGDTGGGGGGALTWSNGLSVEPGQAITVIVGAGGAPVRRAAHDPSDPGVPGEPTILNMPGFAFGAGGGAGGGKGGTCGAGAKWCGGGGGGIGGSSPSDGDASAGGGGAGGYAGAGGDGAEGGRGVDSASGGAGGAGGPGASAAGGGVGLYGITGGTAPGGVRQSPSTCCSGGGGQGGMTSGCVAPGGDAPAGASYGGGGGAGARAAANGRASGAGGGGAVRLMWGEGRSFPYKATAVGSEEVN